MTRIDDGVPVAMQYDRAALVIGKSTIIHIGKYALLSKSAGVL